MSTGTEPGKELEPDDAVEGLIVSRAFAEDATRERLEPPERITTWDGETLDVQWDAKW